MGLKYETETSELAKEAIQRTLIKTDEKSLVICNIYGNEEHADIVLERLSKWSGTVKAARTWESFNLTDEVVFSEPKYKFCYSFFMTQPNGKGTCYGTRHSRSQRSGLECHNVWLQRHKAFKTSRYV